MAPVFNPLGNPSTSRVLFLLILGIDSPKQIADRLEIKSPSAIDQLHRLRKIRLVRLGGKSGREQHYELDWERLVDISVKGSFRLPQPDMKEQEAADFLAKQFLGKKKFREFVKNYLQIRLAETPLNLLIEGDRAFSDIIDDLNATVVGMLSDNSFALKLKESIQDKQELREAFDSLVLWNNSQHHVSDISRHAFVRALQKSGFKIK